MCWVVLFEDLVCGWLMFCLVMLCLLVGWIFLVGFGVLGLGGEGSGVGLLLLVGVVVVVVL